MTFIQDPKNRKKRFERSPRQKSSSIAPCEERLRHHIELLETVKRLDLEQYWISLRNIALSDYWAYLRLVLRFEWVDPWFHGEVLIRFIEENWNESLLILVPRDHGKSTTVTVPMPAYWLAEDPLRSVIVCNATEDKAQAMCAASAAIIESNEIYKKAFPYVVPSDKWGNRGYYCDAKCVPRQAGSVERIDAGIMPRGVRNNITGSHPDGGLILDDLINHETASSELELERSKRFAREAVTCVTGNRSVICIGTRWNEKDLYGDLLEGRILGPRGRFKVLKEGATRKLEDGSEELVWPRRTFIDLQGKPKEAGFTWERLQSEKINRGKLFSALYYNEPVGADDAYFDLKRVKVFSEMPFKLGPVASVAIEVESQAAHIVSTFRVLMRERGRSIRIDEIKATRSGLRDNSKEGRIKAFLGPVVDSMKLNVRDVVWHTEKGLQHEMRNFPKGHDDVIDATAYLADLATDTAAGGMPLVYVMCDPAFTEGAKSDFTAIVTGCKYDGELYILDVKRFQTDKAEVLLGMLMATYDQYNKVGQRQKSKGPRMLGFNSMTARSGRAQRSLTTDPIEFDLDNYLVETDPNDKDK